MSKLLNIKQSTKKNHHWNTPKWIADASKAVLGEIDLDPCSNKTSIIEAKNNWCLPVHDGLAEPWNFKNIFINPPYGRDKVRKTSISNWIIKASDAHLLFRSNVIAVIPAAVDTRYWQDIILGDHQDRDLLNCHASICFLKGRVKFTEKGVEIGPAPMPIAVILWSTDIEVQERFYESFKDHGRILI